MYGSSHQEPLERRVEHLIDAFLFHFPTAVKPLVVRAPGRVNLIGEHTDYNDGYVLPCTVDRDTLLALAPRADQTVNVVSLNLKRSSSFSLAELRVATGSDRWSNYVRGVAKLLLEQGHRIGGVDVVINSTIPVGAGLSSSAALELSSALGLLHVSGDTFPRNYEELRDLALLCQRAENEFVGVSCGIMDQFVIALGQAGQALFLDCRSLEAQHVPLVLDDSVLVIADTGVSRGLGASQYNVRREECREGVRMLQQFLPGIVALRDVSPTQLDAYADRLPEVIRKRCRHVVTENARVLTAAKALAARDLTRFGELMIRSHRSLRDDYEVSCTELDVLVDAALEQEGVYGSRMTGAGFGGCTVTLVQRETLSQFERHVRRAYLSKTGRSPKLYVSGAGDGLKLIRI